MHTPVPLSLPAFLAYSQEASRYPPLNGCPNALPQHVTTCACTRRTALPCRMRLPLHALVSSWQRTARPLLPPSGQCAPARAVP